MTPNKDAQEMTTQNEIEEAIDRHIRRGVLVTPDEVVIIKAAREAKEGREAFELTKRLWLAQTAENLTLKTKLAVAREALELVLDTVGGCHDCWELSAKPQQKLFVNEALAKIGEKE